MDFDLSQIKFSFKDRLKKIRFPEYMTEKLAEDLGIHIGDGSMYMTGPGMKSYEIKCSGHIIDDKDHYNYVIVPLKKELFNVVAKIKLFKPRNNELGFVICSKALYQFYNKVMDIPDGNKTKTCKIPDIVLKSDTNIKLAFVRGLADTDFSLTFKNKSKKHKLHTYPMITANFASIALVNDLRLFLHSLGFNFYSFSYYNKRYEKKYLTHVININGEDNLEKWIDLIGFNNPKHKTKYAIWKEFGFCPPNTNLDERKQILSGEINPYNIYEKSNGGQGEI